MSSSNNSMTFVVTGNTGFLGTRLSNKLTELGHKCIGYDKTDGYDICDKEQFESVFEGEHVDAVIHLAAIADLYIFQNNPELGDKINIEGTRNVLDVCNKKGSRLLFASTCCCYGNNGVHPSDETSPLAPTEPYAKSKEESEKDILAAGGNHCCMRLSTFYGEGMRLALAPATFMDRLHRGLPLHIHGTGKQTRNLTHVDDVVSGIVTIALSEPKYDVVNVVSREVVSVHQMAETVTKVMGLENKCELIHTKDRFGQIFEEDILNDRLKSLGWSPKINFEEGMRRTYKFFLNNGGKFNC